MSFIKSVVGSVVLGAATVIGFLTGFKVWESGLEDFVGEKTEKVFKKKES